jgi:hypothetical protein
MSWTRSSAVSVCCSTIYGGTQMTGLGVGATAMMRIEGCKTRSLFGRCPSLQQAAGEQACEAGPAHD